MNMPVSGLYAALLGILVVVLGFRVTRQRQLEKIAFGDGSREPLARAIAVHRNAIEYIPVALLLLLTAEANHARTGLLQAFGLTLLVARILHAWRLSRHSGSSAGRFLGTLGTWIVMLGLAGTNLWLLARGA